MERRNRTMLGKMGVTAMLLGVMVLGIMVQGRQDADPFSGLSQPANRVGWSTSTAKPVLQSQPVCFSSTPLATCIGGDASTFFHKAAMSLSDEGTNAVCGASCGYTMLFSPAFAYS